MLRKLLLWLANYLKTVEHKPIVLWEDTDSAPKELIEGEHFDIPYNIGSSSLGVNRIGVYGIFESVNFYLEGIKPENNKYFMQLSDTHIWNANGVKALQFTMAVQETSSGSGVWITRFTASRCRVWNFTVTPPTYTATQKVRIMKIVGYTD